MRGHWENSPFVILIVVDGIRLTDTGTKFSKIPWQKKMAELGIARLMHIKNSGTTLTVPGHIALSSGIYGEYANDGSEFSESNPSFLNILSQEPNTYGSLISSKGKLQGALMPPIRYKDNIYVNCGPGGSGRDENRSDQKTTHAVLQEIKRHYEEGRKRTVCIVNFHETDTNAHMSNIPLYFKAISQSDRFIEKIYGALNQYSKDFVLLVTNDHGRHTSDVTSHGCSCKGCRNIYLFAYGPGVNGGIYLDPPIYDQVNLFNTIVHSVSPSQLRGKMKKNIIECLFKK